MRRNSNLACHGAGQFTTSAHRPFGGRIHEGNWYGLNFPPLAAERNLPMCTLRPEKPHGISKGLLVSISIVLNRANSPKLLASLIRRFSRCSSMAGDSTIFEMESEAASPAPSNLTPRCVVCPANGQPKSVDRLNALQRLSSSSRARSNASIAAIASEPSGSRSGGSAIPAIFRIAAAPFRGSPGSIIVTRTPTSAASLASTSEKPSTPHFARPGGLSQGRFHE